MTPQGARTLQKTDAQKFIKRLRKRLYGSQEGFLRYFLCGEYGEHTWRPHYHAILYGLTLDQEADIHGAWGLGHTKIDEVSPARAMYCSSYVTKGMTKKDEDVLGDREPEFALSSRNPALGDRYLQNFAKTLDLHWEYIEREGDIPRFFYMDGRFWPFTYRHAQMVRELVGVPLAAADRPRYYTPPPSPTPDEQDAIRNYNALLERRSRKMKIL